MESQHVPARVHRPSIYYVRNNSSVAIARHGVSTIMTSFLVPSGKRYLREGIRTTAGTSRPCRSSPFQYSFVHRSLKTFSDIRIGCMPNVHTAFPLHY
jgi:hypothetical protein